MRGGYTIVDADGHVQEPADLWDRWLDPEHRADAPVRGDDGVWRWRGAEVTDGLPEAVRSEFGRKTRERYADYLAMGWSPESQLLAMDRMGIDTAYLYPTMGLFLWHQDDLPPALATAMTRAYNDWLADFASADPVRLRPVTAISLLDVGGAVAEVRRGIMQHGTRAVYLRPNPIADRTLASSDLEPLRQLCEEEGVAVAFHEGAHARCALPVTTGSAPTSRAGHAHTRWR